MASNDIRDILNIKDLKVSKDEILGLRHKKKILLPYYNTKVDLPPVVETDNGIHLNLYIIINTMF